MQSGRRFGASMQPIALSLFRSILPIGTLIMLSCSSPYKAEKNGDAMIFQTKTVQVPDSQGMKPLGMTGHDWEIRLALAKRYKEVEKVQIDLSEKLDAFMRGGSGIPANRANAEKLVILLDEMSLIGSALNGKVEDIARKRADMEMEINQNGSFEYKEILDRFDKLTENRYKPAK